MRVAVGARGGFVDSRHRCGGPGGAFGCHEVAEPLQRPQGPPDGERWALARPRVTGPLWLSVYILLGGPCGCGVLGSFSSSEALKWRVRGEHGGLVSVSRTVFVPGKW